MCWLVAALVTVEFAVELLVTTDVSALMAVDRTTDPC